MKSEFEEQGMRYVLAHQKSCSDPNLQIADYLCWAYQKMARGNEWPYVLVSTIFREFGNAEGVMK